MSLGAIDFGLIVDGAIAMVENIRRHVAEKQHPPARPLTATERVAEVRGSAREVALKLEMCGECKRAEYARTCDH